MDRRRGRAQEGQLGRVARHLARIVERRAGRKAWRGVFLLLALFPAGCDERTARVTETARNTRELIVGFPEGGVRSADLGPGQFTRMLSLEGLTWGNVDGRSVPRLAESWTWEDGGRQLRLRLRPGVFFHDGTPLKAKVAVGILQAAALGPGAAGSYSSFADITAITPVGDLEILIRLARPSAFLPDDLDMPLPIRPNVGTGPFRVVKRDSGVVLFERFDRYYGGTPSIERVQMKTFDALRTAWSSLLRGEVDMVTDVPAEAIDFVGTKDVDVIRYKRRYQYMVAFNARQPALASPAVRRALNLAVNRDVLVARALHGYGDPATGPLWPRHWAYDTSIAPFAYDRRQAVELLETAGFPEGRARGASQMPKARLVFTCLLLKDFSLHERVALELQKQLYDVGVDIKFELVSAEDFNDRVREGRFEAVLIDMISGPSFGRPYIFWRSAKQFDGLNKFGYENAEAERLFERLRSSALNEAATRSATNRLQRVFLEDPPALFLAWSERARVVGPMFTPVIDPDRDPVLTMWRWAPRTDAAVGAE